MSNKPTVPFEYGEHTADVLIIAYGNTLEELFKNAALAVANLMYNYEKVECKGQVEVKAEGEDLEQLLFNWIDELLYVFDGRKFAYGDCFKALRVEGSGPYSIYAVLGGEDYNMEKHGYKGLIVKAITYNMLSVKEENGYWKATFVVDI